MRIAFAKCSAYAIGKRLSKRGIRNETHNKYIIQIAKRALVKLGVQSKLIDFDTLVIANIVKILNLLYNNMLKATKNLLDISSIEFEILLNAPRTQSDLL